MGDKFAEFGIAVPPALQTMLDGAKLFADEGLAPILERGQLAGDTLKSLDTIGAVTGQTFATMGATIKGSFNRLVAGGATSEAALMALRPQLATLILLQEKYGFTVDAGTQALIDQAKEAGITGEEAKTAADKQLEAFDKVIAALEQIVELLGGTIPEELDKLENTDTTIDVDVKVDDSELRNVQIPSRIDVPVRFAPVNQTVFRTAVPAGAQVGNFAPRRRFGSPRLDFEDFGQQTMVAAHGREAIVPEGGGHELAAEIAAALGPRLGGGGHLVRIEDGAIRVTNPNDGAALLDAMTDAIQRGGRPASRLFGALDELR